MYLATLSWGNLQSNQWALSKSDSSVAGRCVLCVSCRFATQRAIVGQSNEFEDLPKNLKEEQIERKIN